MKKQPKKYNPYASKLRTKGHAIEDPKQKQTKKDSWNRKAKHKDKTIEEDNMVKKQYRTDEGVLGMSNVPDISRMKELAGMINNSDEKSVNEKFNRIRNIKELGDIDDDSFDVEFPDESDEPEMHKSEYDNDVSELDYNNTQDIGEYDVDDYDVKATDDFENPDQESLSLDHTPAFNNIKMNLDDIERNIDNVKISEYKEILNHIKTVYQSVRNAGFISLQESRRKKK